MPTFPFEVGEGVLEVVRAVDFEISNAVDGVIEGEILLVSDVMPTFSFEVGKGIL